MRKGRPVVTEALTTSRLQSRWALSFQKPCFGSKLDIELKLFIARAHSSPIFNFLAFCNWVKKRFQWKVFPLEVHTMFFFTPKLWTESLRSCSFARNVRNKRIRFEYLMIFLSNKNFLWNLLQCLPTASVQLNRPGAENVVESFFAKNSEAPRNTDDKLLARNLLSVFSLWVTRFFSSFTIEL